MQIFPNFFHILCHQQSLSKLKAIEHDVSTKVSTFNRDFVYDPPFSDFESFTKISSSLKFVVVISAS